MNDCILSLCGAGEAGVTGAIKNNIWLAMLSLLGGTHVERNRSERQVNWFLILLLLIGGWFSYTFIEQQLHLNAVERDYEATLLRLQEAKAQNEALKAECANLNDAAYIEKVARESLGMARSGEMPYISSRR